MANLTANSPRPTRYGSIIVDDLPMVAAAKVYQGAALSIQNSSGNTGYVHNLVATEDFAGFANVFADNTNGSNGTLSLGVQTEGEIQLSVTGATVASVDATVYASDGNTFTTTSSGNTSIGKITRWLSGTLCMVKFQANSRRSI